MGGVPPTRQITDLQLAILRSHATPRRRHPERRGDSFFPSSASCGRVASQSKNPSSMSPAIPSTRVSNDPLLDFRTRGWSLSRPGRIARRCWSLCSGGRNSSAVAEASSPFRDFKRHSDCTHTRALPSEQQTRRGNSHHLRGDGSCRCQQLASIHSLGDTRENFCETESAHNAKPRSQACTPSISSVTNRVQPPALRRQIVRDFRVQPRLGRNRNET
jgi:hypothetical protein